MNINPLKKDIGDLVDKFLDDETYYEKFKSIAKTKEVDLTNKEAVKLAMFTIKNNELVFTDPELSDLFLEWQVYTNLKDTEPYATLLKTHPERKSDLVDLAVRIFNKEEITTEDIEYLFREANDINSKDN